MDLAPLIDFANQANAEIGRFQLGFALTPHGLSQSTFELAGLTWSSIRYGDAEIDQVPSDRRGIYAFVVTCPGPILPPHGYVLYIGIAGKNSNRSLRARYEDYLNPQKVVKRPRIARMIGDWHSVLRFYFASVDAAVTSKQLQALELQLNTVMLPPFSEGDLEAGIKRLRRAFR